MKRIKSFLTFFSLFAFLIIIFIFCLILYCGSSHFENKLRNYMEEGLSRMVHGRVSISQLEVFPMRLKFHMKDFHAQIFLKEETFAEIHISGIMASFRFLSLMEFYSGSLSLSKLLIQEPEIFVRVKNIYEQKDSLPKVRGPKRKIKLGVRKLDIVNGQWTFQEKTIPLDISAEDVALTLTSFPLFQEAFLSSKVHIRKGWQISDRYGHLRLHFRKRLKTVHLLDLTFQDGNNRFHLAGDISLRKGIESHLKMSSTVVLSEIPLPQRFKKDSLKGIVRIEGKIHGKIHDPLFEGDFSAQELLFSRMKARVIKGQLTISKKGFAVKDLYGKAMKGSFQGSLEGVFQKDRKILNLLLSIESVDLSQITRLSKRSPWVFHGLASAKARILMKIAPFELMDGDIRMSIRRKEIRDDEGARTMEGEMELQISDGEVKLKKALLKADSISLQAQGILYPFERNDATFTISSSSLRKDIPLLEPLLKNMKNIHIKEGILTAVEGRGQVSGSTGWDGHVTAQCDIRLSALSLFQHPWGDLWGSLSFLQGKKLECPSMRWSGPQGSGSLKGFVVLQNPLEYQWEGRTEGLSIQALLPLFGSKFDSGGKLFSSFLLYSHHGKRGGHLKGEIRKGHLLGESFDRAEGLITIEPWKTILSGWSIIKGKGKLSLSGEYRQTEKSLALDFKGRDLDASTFTHFIPKKFEIYGTWLLHGHAFIKNQETEAFCQAESENVTLGQWNVGKVIANLKLDDPHIFYSFSSEEWRSTLSGTILLKKNFPLEGFLEFQQMDYKLIEQILPMEPTKLKGSLTGRAAFRGDLKKWKEISVKGMIASFEIQAGKNIYRNASAFSFDYSSGLLQSHDLQVKGEDTELLIDASIDMEHDQMKLSVKGTFDLSMMEAFIRNISLSGRGSIEARAEGSFQNPYFHGKVQIRQGNLSHVSLPYPVEHLSLEGHFDRDFLILSSISFDFAGGKVHGKGVVSLQKLRYEAYSLDLHGKDVLMTFPEGMKYSCDPKLIIRGDRSGVVVSGEVSIIRGLYYKDFSLESRFMSFKGREYQPFRDQDMPENIFLDLDIIVDDGFWVKNDLVHVELAGNLHAGGDLNRVQLTGHLSALEGGTFEIRGVEYEIREGHLDFVDLTRIFPTFDLKAHTEVAHYEIELTATGSMERFDYQLSSNPALPPQDIIALLLTGTTLESMSQEGRSSVPGDLAASYIVGSLSKKIEKKLQKELHLEKVQIDPMLIKSQTDPSARVTFGKNISPEVMLIYSIDLTDSERNAYQIDYNIRKNFKFTMERTESGALGGDLRHRTHFSMKKILEGVELKDKAKKKRKEEGTIIDITFPVRSPFSRKRLLQKVPFKKGSVYQRKLVLEGSERIKAFLIKKGFLEAIVKHKIEKVEAGYRIHYMIHFGPQIDIILKGATKKEEKKIRKKMAALVMESLFPKEMFHDIEEMIRVFYQERGYYNVDVFTKMDEFKNKKNIEYLIDKGDQVIVDRIVIEGNRAFDQNKICKQMLIEKESLFGSPVFKPSILQDDILAIKNLYRENGYAEVTIDEPLIQLSRDGQKATIKINIEEGPSVRIGEVIFQGNEMITSGELLKRISSQSQSLFIPSHVQRDELMLQQYYDSRGFPEARVSSDVSIHDSLARLVFKINEGERKKIGEVTITGNNLTRTKIIRRELLFKKGDYLSKNQLLKSQHALYRLGLFKKVFIDPSSSSVAGIDDIKVKVEEADNIHVSLGGGFDNLSGPRGHFEIMDTNFFGYDRFVSLLLRGSSRERRIQVIFKEPRLFARKLDSLFSSYFHREEKESFTEQRVATTFQLEKKWTPHLTSYFRYNYQNVELSDLMISVEELRQEEPKLEDVQLSNIGFSFIRDTRDDPFIPGKGTYASIDYRLFSEVIGSEANFMKLFLQGAHFKDIGKNIILASSMRFGIARAFAETTFIPLSERFFAGGDSSLRGFARDRVGPEDPLTGKPIGGESVLLINEELRIPLWPYIKGVLFYDTGNVYERLEEMKLFELRHVIGAGLRIETPIGPLRFEYGRKINRQKGESHGEFFISIGPPF